MPQWQKWDENAMMKCSDVELTESSEDGTVH